MLFELLCVVGDVLLVLVDLVCVVGDVLLVLVDLVRVGVSRHFCDGSLEVYVLHEAGHVFEALVRFLFMLFELLCVVGDQARVGLDRSIQCLNVCVNFIGSSGLISAIRIGQLRGVIRKINCLRRECDGAKDGGYEERFLKRCIHFFYIPLGNNWKS